MKIYQLTINRWVTMTNSNLIELYGICDASETACGACIYATLSNGNGIRTAQFLCAKSRVAASNISIYF